MRRIGSGSAAREGGYVLLFVMAALTVMAIVAARFASRIDELREQALDMQQYADARLRVASARARALYWLSTRPTGFSSSGYVDEEALALDGRLYLTPEGAYVTVQDERGLLSLNMPDRELLVSALVQLGTTVDAAMSAVDVLEDYADTDNLRRINGAEASDYAALGLPPPRNDWILSVGELGRMPVWSTMGAARERLAPWLGVRRDKLFNPNTAPLGLLKSVWPKQSAEQWDLFDTLRRRAPFGSAAAATAATGIPFLGENLLFHASNALRVQVWAPGLPQALEYNLLILPTGGQAPWLIHEVRQTRRPVPTVGPNAIAASSSASSVAPFPVPSQAVAGPRKANVSAP